MMFEDDDFFINEDELAAENQLNLVDNAKSDILGRLEELMKTLKENIKFRERADFDANLKIVLSQFDVLLKLHSADASGMDDEEQLELIKEAQKLTTELSYDNIDDFVEKDEEEDTVSNDIDDIGDGTDF